MSDMNTQQPMEIRLGTFELMFNELNTTKMVFYNTLRKYMVEHNHSLEFEQFNMFEVTSAKSTVSAFSTKGVEYVDQNLKSDVTARIIINAAVVDNTGGPNSVFSLQVIKMKKNDYQVLVDDGYGRYHYLKTEFPHIFMKNMTEVMEATNINTAMSVCENTLNEALQAELHSHTSNLHKSVQKVPKDNPFYNLDEINVMCKGFQFTHPYVTKLRIALCDDTGGYFSMFYYYWSEEDNAYKLDPPTKYSAKGDDEDNEPIPEFKEPWCRELIYDITAVIDGIIGAMQKSIEKTKNEIKAENPKIKEANLNAKNDSCT